MFWTLEIPFKTGFTVLWSFLSKGKNNNVGTMKIILPLFSFINGEMVTDHKCSKTAVL
jgi:hypothetical protein